MAVTTALSRNMRKVGSAIRRFAANARIYHDDLAIAGVLDRSSERIYINVGVKGPFQRDEWYAGIQEEIAVELGRSPSFAQMGIVIRQVDDINAFYDQIPVDDDDLDLTDWLSWNG